MATYITLMNFTAQGLNNVKNSVKRAEAAKKAATKAGDWLRSVDRPPRIYRTIRWEARDSGEARETLSAKGL